MALVVLSGCGRPSAEEYAKRAEEEFQRALHVADSLGTAADAARLFAPSMEYFTTLVREYPGTPEAEQAQFRLGTIQQNVLRDPAKALSTYEEYAAAYPEGRKLAEAMFLIGFICNNELHDSVKAATAYTRFLQRFPDHELAASARFELETMGRSPDEILEPPAAPPSAARTRKGTRNL
jgi:tetratricopeptide (TPR) repeat protein